MTLILLSAMPFVAWFGFEIGREHGSQQGYNEGFVDGTLAGIEEEIGDRR